MTFAALYAACAGRLQGRTWTIQVTAGTYYQDGCQWQIYVAEVKPHFAQGGTPEHALAQLDAMLALEGKPSTTDPSDVGLCEVNP